MIEILKKYRKPFSIERKIRFYFFDFVFGKEEKGDEVV
jgi:hypothetical protein